MHRPITFTFLAALGLLWTSSPAQDRPTSTTSFLPFRDSALPIALRVRDIVTRLTLEEKIKQMLYNAPAIERLGIPAYSWWSEALHGVARAGKATVFPQAIGLAATFDTDLMLRVATVTSDEARAKYHAALNSRGATGIYEGLTFFSPNINIFRDPRWGRGMETYGEDPYLTGTMGVAFIRGMQGSDPRYLKTAATAKHFAVHSGPEPERHVFNAVVDERDLRETYLPAFRAAVVDGGVASVMCAYNRYFGQPCCGSSALLQTILRDEWKFRGYVVSDCWAISDFYQFHKTSRTETEAAATALMAGTDLECGVSYDSLITAVRTGAVPEALIDRAVSRLFEIRFRLGMFDPPDIVPYSRLPLSSVDSPDHRALALEAARRSIVLLKNENRTLPLSRSVRTVAVIGPNADDVELLLGNYNGWPGAPVTPLEGIRRKLGPGSKVLYAKGCDVADHTPALETVPGWALSAGTAPASRKGLKGEYFGNNQLTGTAAVVRTDPTVDFQWWEAAPAKGIPADSFSVRWTGTLLAPATGVYALGARVFGRFRMFLDDTLLTEYSDRHVVFAQTREVHLRKGVRYPIRLEYGDRRPDAFVQLVWSVPNAHTQDEAVSAARKADVVVMMLGLSPRLEGEEMPVAVEGFSGGDRTRLDLPRQQEELLEAVTAVGKPVVLVLLNGSALAVQWASQHVSAIVEAWYPGQAAGSALADVLFGDTNPSGRLPVTFYRSAGQLPPFNEYAMAGRTYRYFDGDPLYPFGFGLSYTTFGYRNLELAGQVETGSTVTVTAEVENTGPTPGDEVVQLYVSNTQASVPVPLRSLAGFKRIFLAPGQKAKVSFSLTPRELSVIDDTGARVEEPGTFRVSVGGGQPDLKGGPRSATSGIVSSVFRVTGHRLAIEER